MTAWPNGEMELEAAASLVARLVNAPFVALYRTEESENAGCLGWKQEGSLEKPDPGAIQAYVIRKIRQSEGLFAGVGGSSVVLKQLQVAGELPPGTLPTGVTHLAIINLSSDKRVSVYGGKGGRNRVDFGWLVVGSPRAFGTREETLCLAAAQRLSGLADSAALESALQLRNQFLSIASHELKTPLTSIYGVLQLQERMLRLGKKTESPEQERERQESYLKMVIRQTRRLNELIDGLLDLSRIQNGRFMAEPSDIDVSSLVKETVSGRLSVIAQEAGVRLSTEVPEDLRAWVDPVRMEEVVSNLVMNAIRFSPEGGVVWVRLRSVEGELHLTVRDQGPSVPVEDRERIFQPFERAQRTARFGGLGLGLFISRQIAQLHGGDVVLSESLPGKGNVFEATFSQRAA